MGQRISVGDLIEALEPYDRELPVVIDLRGGGGVSIERRDLVSDDGKGEAIIGIYASNGGRFGHDPLTDEEYEKRKLEFLDGLYDTQRQKSFGSGFKRFTTIHGDYRIYNDYGGQNDTCYGTAYDERIIMRMVSDGLLEFYKQDYSRDGVRMTDLGKAHVKQQS